MAKFYAV